jgi:hypothetical protein
MRAFRERFVEGLSLGNGARTECSEESHGLFNSLRLLAQGPHSRPCREAGDDPQREPCGVRCPGCAERAPPSASLLRWRPLRKAADAAAHTLVDISADLPLFCYFVDPACRTATGGSSGWSTSAPSAP